MSDAPAVNDAHVARILAASESFADWRHQPLDDRWLDCLDTADRQTLMTLVAEALSRLTRHPFD